MATLQMSEAQVQELLGQLEWSSQGLVNYEQFVKAMMK
jgi:Ca2+-binding EF-hand superfamily protein